MRNRQYWWDYSRQRNYPGKWVMWPVFLFAGTLFAGIMLIVWLFAHRT